MRKTSYLAGELAGRGTMLVLPLRCDSRGFIYLRNYNPEIDKVPVVRISPDGERKAFFRVSAAPEFANSGAIDYAVGLRGEVYFLTSLKRQPVIVKFREDGSFESTTKLDSRFDPNHLAVFASGDFLVVGHKLSEKRGRTSERFTGIFDRGGRLLRELRLPGDPAPEPEDKKPRTEDPDPPEDEALELGQAEPAEDGNIYLMRASSPPQVHVISPAGDLLRTLTIRPPAEGFKVGPMQVAGGKVVLEFNQDSPDGTRSIYLFTVSDAVTGEKTIEYVPPANGTGTFACYTPNGFTFLTTMPGGRRALSHLAPY